MQKAIRVFSIIATSLAGLSLLLLLLTIPLQSALAGLLYNASSDVLALLPQIPVSQLIFIFLNFALILLTIFFCGKNNVGIWFDILTVCALAFILPSINTFGSIIGNLFSVPLGSNQLAINNIISAIANYCLLPGNLGIIITYMVCGMSIAFKQMSKKDYSVNTPV